MGTNQRAQITMTDDEIAGFVERSRTATMATIGPTGTPHLVAMWFAVIDGQIWFETKARSQKAQNLGRDPRLTCMIEDGLTYDTLRGVSIEGRGTIVDEPEALWNVGVNVWERYTGPYTEEAKPLVASARGTTASWACPRWPSVAPPPRHRPRRDTMGHALRSPRGMARAAGRRLAGHP
jgi:PPOX class probable F420-dependent enzyme